jgi:hypothetical protein
LTAVTNDLNRTGRQLDFLIYPLPWCASNLRLCMYTHAPCSLCVKFVLIPSRFSCDYARLCIQFSERDYIIAASTQ